VSGPEGSSTKEDFGECRRLPGFHGGLLSFRPPTQPRTKIEEQRTKIPAHPGRESRCGRSERSPRLPPLTLFGTPRDPDLQRESSRKCQKWHARPSRPHRSGRAGGDFRLLTLRKVGGSRSKWTRQPRSLSKRSRISRAACPAPSVVGGDRRGLCNR